MTTEQLFATVVGIIVVTAFATGVSGFVLWFFFIRKETRLGDGLQLKNKHAEYRSGPGPVLE